MENLNNVPSTGTFGGSVSKINSNFDLVVNAINSLEYQTTRSKGILNYGQNPATVFPNAVAGDWCMILSEGNVFPATIKTFNGSTWSGSGTWNPEGVDLTQYAQKSEMTTAIANSLAQATARMGYGECTVSGTSLEVSIPNFILPTNGGQVHIKMSAVGTGASTLSINGTTAKTLWYNGKAVSSTNTWEAGEIISVFYDGAKYMASNSQGGGGKAEKISFDNSNSWIESNDVQGALDDIANIFQDGSPESDLDIADEDGNVLVMFSGGHVQTKNFDSREIKTSVDNTESADFAVADEDGNVVLSVSGGHIRTKNFDSENIELNDYAKKKTIKYLAIGNSVNQDPACYIPYLLRKLYGDDIDFEIGVAYHGSYTIKDYVELMITGQVNLETFSYAKNTGHLTNITNVPLSYAVGYADWDIVSFEAYQTDMAGSGRDEDVTLAPDLLDWLKQHTKDGCRFGLVTPATYTDVRDLYVGWQQDILTSCSLDFLLDYGATKEFLIAKGFVNSDLSPLEGGRYIHSKEGFPCEALALTAIHFLADIVKIDDKASNLLLQITEIEHNAMNVPQQNGTYTSTTEEGWRKCVDAALNGWRVSRASYAISNNTLRDNTFTNI